MSGAVNSRLSAYDVYVGRPGPFGNPFSHLEMTTARYRVRNRKDAVAAYEAWLVGQPELVARIKKDLAGKVLGCPCGGLPCHADVLVRIANEVPR